MNPPNQPFFTSWIDAPMPSAQRHSTVMQFQNGYRISIVYGAGLYSRDMDGFSFKGTFDKDKALASSVEIAIFNPNNEFIPFKDGQDVKGYVTPDELADIILWTRNL